MKTSRIWMGIGTIVAVTLAIVIAFFAEEIYSSGQVQGTVYYEGRPVSGGLIRFDAVPFGSALGAYSYIDENGHFACQSDWQRDDSGRVRFRIVVELDLPRAGPDRPLPEQEGDVPMEDGAGPAMPGQDGGAQLMTKVISATMLSPGVQTGGPSTGSSPGATRRTFEIGPTILLGRAPAHLEIKLKDWPRGIRSPG